MKNNIIQEKSEAFALRIIKLYQYLTTREQNKEFVLSKQLLRSGTSIGANIAEAECGISPDDFRAKMYIAFKECSESIYWIKLLYKSGFLNESQYNSLMDDCSELRKILSSITKTSNENKAKK